MSITSFLKESRTIVLGTLWVIGIVLLFQSYSNPFQGSNSFILFWISILLCMIPAFILLLDNSLSWKGKIFVLFIWGITMYLPKILRSPTFLNFQDEILHIQTLQLIQESGTLSINPTIFPIGMYYPGLQLATFPLTAITLYYRRA